MMNEKRGILERTKLFVLCVVRLYSTLPRTAEAQAIGKQILRCGTSSARRFARGNAAGRMRK